MFPAKSGEAARHRAENVPTETASVFSKVVNIPTQGKNRGKRWDENVDASRYHIAVETGR